jgi:LysM repeat protein
MEEVDLERLVLPALLALLILGAFMILLTSGGSEESLAPLAPATVNTTPATTPAKAPATSVPAPSGRFVKVKQGDTADSIATAVGMTVDELAELNPSIDLNSLRTGQTLKLAR